MGTISASCARDLSTSGRRTLIDHAPITPANIGNCRVAVVHDWLTGMRGGEIALEHILALVPDAKLFTLLHTSGSVSTEIEAHRPQYSFIQYLPFAHTNYRNYLPLFPAAVEQFDLDDYDLVISTSHCAAKAAVVTGRARHLCYCFTPMRYAWDQFEAYFGAAHVGPWKNRIYRFAMNRIARWDAGTAGRVHRYLAISQHVAKRIRRYYDREADVIYPPVDIDFYRPNGSAPGEYFLVVSALVPYKRIDLAIDACRLANVPLRIVGTGPDADSLKSRADSNVEFMPYQSDEELRVLYQGARGFLLTGEEDFGIAPLEAQACGRPVIALAQGGARETVAHGVTGLLVDEPTPEAFATAIQQLGELTFSSIQLHTAASRFSSGVFQSRMRTVVEEFATRSS